MTANRDLRKKCADPKNIQVKDYNEIMVMFKFSGGIDEAEAQRKRRKIYYAQEQLQLKKKPTPKKKITTKYSRCFCFFIF